MPDVQVSIHGRKLGIDASGNAVIGEGNSVFASNNASTKAPRIATGAVATAPTTAAGLVSYGVHWLSSAQGTYALEDPVPGQRVTIITQSQTTAAARLVQTSTVNGVTMGTSGAYNKWSSTAAHTLELVGITTSIFGVVANNANSTVSTSVGVFSTV